jgi:hypothetical protein
MSQRTRDEEVDYVARMVLAVVQAIAADPSRPSGQPKCQRRPARERIGPSPVYHELERLLAAGAARRPAS